VNKDLLYSRKKLGTFFKALRLWRELSLRTLGEKAGISAGHIFKMETGDADFTLELFVKLCSALGVPPGWAIDHAANSNPEYFRDYFFNGHQLRSFYEKFNIASDGGRFFACTFMGDLCSVAAQLMRSTNPRHTILRLGSSHPFTNWFMPFVSALSESISPLENLARIDSLLSDPHGELARLGVLTDERIEQYLCPHLLKYKADFEESLEKIPRDLFIHWIHLDRDLPPTPELWRYFVFAANEINVQDSVMPPIPSTIRQLMERIQERTQGRGSRAKLATTLGVPPQRLNDWIHGRNIPNGEAALQLLKWVEAEEAKTQQQSNPGTVDAVPGRVTRNRKLSINEKPKSGRSKK
jgi:transcriptional regulator with XRE-family HTH domain